MSATIDCCKHRHAALQIEPEIDGDLLVARAAGMQASAGVADARDQFALDEGVNVFVFLRGRRVEEASSAPRASTCCEAAIEWRLRRRGQHAGAGERPRPRAAAADIVLEQPAVETKRPAERDQRRVGIAFKTS